MTAIPLSVCIMPSKKEEDNIQEALETVQWADDIVVIDAHSTDRTGEIARVRHGARVRAHWPGFSAENFAMEQTRHEWVLSLDADERLSPACRRNSSGFVRQGCRRMRTI